MKLDVLAIAAHPDDKELTGGGDSPKDGPQWLQDWHSGPLLAGEMGTRGTPETRAKEVAKSIANDPSRQLARHARTSRL